MVSALVHLIVLAFTLFPPIKPVCAGQFYDKLDCGLEADIDTANYHCTSDTKPKPCKTFLVYRGHLNHSTLSSISSLFSVNQTEFFILNNLTRSNATDLPLHRDVLIPIDCSCHGNLSFSIINYTSSGSDNISSIACSIFQGLTKPITLMAQNYHSALIPNSSRIQVPIKCACPDRFDSTAGVKYLVTYPVALGDEPRFIASEFNVSNEAISKANGLDSEPTIFPQTTLLVPVNQIPFLYKPYPPPPANINPALASAVDLTPVSSHTKPKRRNTYIILGAGVCAVILFAVMAYGLVLSGRRKKGKKNVQTSSGRSSQAWNFSQDFLDGMTRLRQPLSSYGMEELKIATGHFSDAFMISGSMYRGRINGNDLAIEQVSMDEANRSFDILTKINHVNIVKLQGFCFRSRPYLVFEYAGHGCLRDCLSNPTLAREFTWKKRIQIAFDMAVALHYLHCCTNPCYVHGRINAINVLITTDWRAKIAGFGSARPLVQTEDLQKEEDDERQDTWILRSKICSASTRARSASYKEVASMRSDIFAFGRVSLEILSGREFISSHLFQSLTAFKTQDNLREVEVLEELMDPTLAGDYPLGDALCLAALARACVDENPLQRPTMNDVLKTLSRIV